MGWLTGWFRRRADDSAAADREARPRDFETPLSGEGPPRVPDRHGTGAGPTNSAPAATPQAGAAAAAVGGAVLLGAELLHSLASDPASAASADKAEAVADTPPDGEAHEAAPEPSSTERAADAPAPAEHHRDAGVDASDRDDGDGGGDAGDGGGGDGGD